MDRYLVIGRLPITLDMVLEETQEKIATLNKMAEVLINLKSEYSKSRNLARYEFKKLNMTKFTTMEQIGFELYIMNQKLEEASSSYLNEVRRLDSFNNLLDRNIYNSFETKRSQTINTIEKLKLEWRILNGYANFN